MRLETKKPNPNSPTEVTIRHCVINALRMRPERIVVGECRGGEALDMLQAMNTGHDGSMTTIHANTPRDCISRLETLVLMAGADLPAENDVFARALVEGTLKHQAEADGIITRLAPAYPVSQLSPIDRNVLRLAIYELFHDNNVPVRVAINEAVELAKEFGSESSAKFVNGVLSSVATLVQRD